MFRLDGKIAAVIGAGSGIGEAVAIGAAEQGATVICLDANEPAARGVAKATCALVANELVGWRQRA